MHFAAPPVHPAPAVCCESAAGAAGALQLANAYISPYLVSRRACLRAARRAAASDAPPPSPPTQVYKVTESALADILAAFQDTYTDLDDKLTQVETAYDAFAASQFGNFGARARPAGSSTSRASVADMLRLRLRALTLKCVAVTCVPNVLHPARAVWGSKGLRVPSRESPKLHRCRAGATGARAGARERAQCRRCCRRSSASSPCALPQIPEAPRLLHGCYPTLPCPSPRARAVSPVLSPVKRELDTLAARLNSSTVFHSAAVDAAADMFRRFAVVQHAPARSLNLTYPTAPPGAHEARRRSGAPRGWRRARHRPACACAARLCFQPPLHASAACDGRQSIVAARGWPSMAAASPDRGPRPSACGQAAWTRPDHSGRAARAGLMLGAVLPGHAHLPHVPQQRVHVRGAVARARARARARRAQPQRDLRRGCVAGYR